MPTVYPEKIMRGNTYVRNTVGKFLYQQMPLYIDLMRAQYDDINKGQLPYPKQYNAIDPYDSGNHKYPIVGAYFPGTDNFTRTNILPSGASMFDGEYEATLFVVADTPIVGTTASGLKQLDKPERSSAIRVRDDLMAIMRACLLEIPSCGTAGQSNRIVIDRNSLKESYQEPIRVNNQDPRWIAAGFMNVNIQVSESTSVPIIGTANIFNIITDTLF